MNLSNFHEAVLNSEYKDNFFVKAAIKNKHEFDRIYRNNEKLVLNGKEIIKIEFSMPSVLDKFKDC